MVAMSNPETCKFQLVRDGQICFCGKPRVLNTDYCEEHVSYGGSLAGYVKELKQVELFEEVEDER